MFLKMYYVKIIENIIIGFIGRCKEVVEIHTKVTNKFEKLLLKKF